MNIRATVPAMGLISRIETVRARHRRLDERVVEEQGRPLPDASVLQKLKRERLKLKDELQRYDGVLRTVSRGRATA